MTDQQAEQKMQQRIERTLGAQVMKIISQEIEIERLREQLANAEKAVKA